MFYKKYLTALCVFAITATAQADSFSQSYRSEFNRLEFVSPSKNIKCQGDFASDVSSNEKGWDGVECSVFKDNMSQPELPQPKDCDLDSITVFQLTPQGKAKRDLGCSGDPYYNPNPEVKVLPYGKTLHGKGWQCTSSKQGMRCINRDKHGFELNQRRQMMF